MFGLDSVLCRGYGTWRSGVRTVLDGKNSCLEVKMSAQEGCVFSESASSFQNSAGSTLTLCMGISEVKYSRQASLGLLSEEKNTKKFWVTYHPSSYVYSVSFLNEHFRIEK